MAGGFKVGGQGDIPITNGDVHGRGVYTATGPNTPMHYVGKNGNGNCAILTKALEGVKGEQGKGDCCWAPRGDWLVFKTGEQLLPTYVVHWG